MVSKDVFQAYLYKKCGSSRMPGITMKAGKVTRLKTPKTMRNERTMQDPIDDRCYVPVS